MDTNTEQSATQSPPPRKRRGFACMAPERVREIARRGGKAAHAAGTAHEFSADEARAAGRKGGLAAQKERRKVYEEMTRGQATGGD